MIGAEGEKHFFVDGYGVRQKNRWVNGGSSYAKEDGTLAENEWLEIDGKKVMGIPADQLFEPDEQIRYKLQLMERQIRYANREGRNHG